MSAPSFSSFPPSFGSFPDLEAGPSARSPPPLDHSRHSKRQSKKRDRDEGARKDNDTKRKLPARRKHRDAEVGYGGLHDESDIRATQIEEIRMHRSSSPQPYFTDRKGDPLNVQYGSIHAGSVPRYHLVSGGKAILGLEPAWRVVHRGHRGVEVAVGGRRKIEMPTLTDAHSRHLLNSAPTRRLLSSLEDKYKYEEVEGFLRLPSRRERKGDPTYRSITENKHDADSDDTASSEEDPNSSSDDSDTMPMTSLQAKLKLLEEQLSQDTSSITTWFSLLSHTLSTVPIMSKNSQKARAEITLSVLSRALRAHPNNQSSRALRLRYIKAGEEIWDRNKIWDEWEDTLKIGGIDLWVEWLDWRIRKGEKGLDGIVEDARRAIASNSEDEIGGLRIMWRVAVAFRDAGYTERANALFQAQAELAYRAPPGLVNQEFEQQLDSLEEFWESEVPRVGEANAEGWAKWEQSGQQTAPLAREYPDLPVNAANGDPYRRWAALELLSDRKCQLPARSSDESTDVDPYATILFSDIRPLLSPIRSPAAKHALRMIWLAFLGLHVPGFLQSVVSVPEECTDDRWAHVHLVSPAYLAYILPLEIINGSKHITADAQAGVLIGREREYRSAFGPVKHWGHAVLYPLEDLEGGQWRMWRDEDVAGIDRGLVREIFAQCRTGDDTEWETLALAFEVACNSKEALRISKLMLASHQDSLAHWAAHARLERIRGRLDGARKVYRTVLAASDKGSAPLWWDWAELEWLLQRSDLATEVIMRSVGTQGTGEIAVLRTKRQLQENIAQISPTSWKESELWVKLYALLELLSSSAESALSVIDAKLITLERGTEAHESMLVSSLILLYRHSVILRNPLPPAILRERAEIAISLYPSNTIILGIFLEAQKGQGIWGGVRAMLGENAADGVMKEKDLVRRVAEVWVACWEKGRWQAEQERTRGGLSAGIESARTQGSAILWRLYLEFEIRVGQLERAKKLLFRAVGECPLVKELYLLAFGPLRGVFSARELNEWAETMVERGIRMRRGLDELLEGWAEDQDMKDEESDAEDEIEHNARELRRLMPY